MITISREPCPTSLSTALSSPWKNELCRKRKKYYKDLLDFRSGILPAEPKRPHASKTHYGNREVREALELMFGSKCAYCEGEVAATSYQHVEHYRPSARYPALSYEWTNLLLVCTKCNCTYKNDKFPLFPSGNTLNEHRRNPCVRTGVGENPLILNPCDDVPEQHLTFRKGWAVALSDRGRYTRLICGLNRDELLKSRRKWLNIALFFAEEYKDAVDNKDSVRTAKFRAQLRELFHRDTPYCGMIRSEIFQLGIDWRTL